MLKKIKYINNFASFRSFDWDTSVRDTKGNNICEFKKLNLIYGRNYSGKTTLSRVFSCIEKNNKNPQYFEATFRFECDNHDDITQNNVVINKVEARTYNSDFVRENLKWLHDGDGGIKPFAIIGGDNVNIDNEIKDLEDELGEVGRRGTARHEENRFHEHLSQKLKEYKDLDEAISNQLRSKAKTIKENAVLYNEVNYQITRIERDIEEIKALSPELLAEPKVEELKELIKEELRDPIQNIDIPSDCDEVFDRCAIIFEKEIRPTKTIQDLVDNALLENWVRSGAELHREKRSDCAFCNQTLPDNIWDRLGQHFSSESEELRASINRAIQEVSSALDKLSSLKLPDESAFYRSFRAEYKRIKNRYIDLINNQREFIGEIDTLLNERLNNIFCTVSPIKKSSYHGQLKSQAEEINKLIDSCNNESNLIESKRGLARKKLRINEVQVFIKEIDLDGQLAKLDDIKALGELKESAYEKASATASDLKSKIIYLNEKKKDESKGASKVNEYLNHHFGADTLRLESMENEEGSHFVVKRDGQEAFNLSEGECSLISFCYFMAKFDDIHSQNKKLVIWIDDPISSLDANHIFFVYSLIETILTKRKNYDQLFISTHNLDFFKYLKRLTKPYISLGPGKNKEDVEYFMAVKGEPGSAIKVMPSYLKKYITEFNYLFEQIYKCATIENPDDNHECFYGFGNNLRKFLEAYLFYKYPTNRSINDKLNMFFANDVQSVELANRLNNELSHLEEIFDRSMRPLEIPEIPRLAKYVINTIEKSDPEQFRALVESIG